MTEAEPSRLAWIIDDDDEMRHAVQLMLQMLDFQVQSFREARAAAQLLLQGKRPHLVFLDINMPEVTGMDMLEFLQSRKGLKSLPVVMLTTESSDLKVDEAMQLGARGFLSKPVTIEELEEIIGRVLGTR